MNVKLSISILVILTLNLLSLSYGERTKDQMYEHFDGRASCFRRLNATHQTGCSSKRDGSTGIIHFVEHEDDLDFILKTGSAGRYMPIIPTFLLTATTITLLKQSEKVSGLVVYNDTTKELEHYSHELTCPNPRSGLPNTCDKPWNKHGTRLLHEDLPFPIYYVNNDDDLGKMRDCFAKFNNFSYETQYQRSLCSIELDAFMYATTDTPTCIRRSNSKTNLNPVKFCDPLGGENVWGALFPLDGARNEVPGAGGGTYIVVAARMDATSMFNGDYPGAVSPITGLVTLLATADLLKRMVVHEGVSPEKNILFMLFSGESYDYIGSQRLVYDMQNDEFPMGLNLDIKNPVPLIHLEDISLFIELSQLSKSKSLFAHLSQDNSYIKSFVGKLQRNAKFTDVVREPVTVPPLLPPASLQTFLKARNNMSGLVLADHGDEYANKYYNSIFDNGTNVDYHYYNVSGGEVDGATFDFDSIQQFTANVSEMLARSLYSEVMNKEYMDKASPRLDLIDELYNCYLLDPDCKVHQAVQRKKLKETPYNSYSLYVGVTVVPNLLTYVIGLTLGWLTGDVVTLNKTCISDPHDPMFQYFNMSKSLDDLNTTLCFRTTMNFTEAISPAFLIDDYDWKSNKYSSWSESTWKDLTVRMFLKPSAAHERFTIAIGSITLVMSLILVYFVKSRSHILFVTPENCSPTSC